MTPPAVTCEPESSPGWVERAQAWLKSPWLMGAMGLGLLWALYAIAPPSEWMAALRQAEPLWLVGAVALVLPHELLKMLRMEQLLPAVRSARLEHSRIIYQMSCVAQLPVGTLGGDIYRICRLEACGATTEDATAATFILRLLGFATTLSLAGIAGVFIVGEAWPLLGPALASTLIFILARSQNPPAWLTRLVARADDTPRTAWGSLLSASARLLRHIVREAAALSRQQILRVLGVTLAIYGVRALIVWLCLLAIDLDVSYPVALAALAAGNLACSIPSPAGTVGLREGGMVGVMAAFGTAVAPATIGALLFRAAIIVGAGIGLIVSTAAARLRRG